MEKQVSIHTPNIQLQQFLKLAGLSMTGGDAKNAILSGHVTVNGVVCTQRGKKLSNGDVVTIDGENFRIAEEPAV